MDETRIDQYVRCLLESWAVSEDGTERVVWHTLHDLLMAVSRFELMSDAEKDMTTKLCKKLQYHFETKFNLKDRKRKTKKENFPPNPLIKEKEKKEKEEKMCVCVGDADLEAFRKECLSYIGQYDQQLVANFYNYWTERDTTSRMRWQKQRFWNTGKRLARWVKNQYSSDISAASERLTKARGKQQKQQAMADEQAAQAQQRTEANDQLEREIAHRKATAVSYEEWQAMKAGKEAAG